MKHGVFQIGGSLELVCVDSILVFLNNFIISSIRFTKAAFLC